MIRTMFAVKLAPLLFSFFLLSITSCKKVEKAGAMSFTLSPPNVTVLNNTLAYTCADKAKGTSTPSGSASTASFRNLTIKWRSTTSALTVIALRITGKDNKGATIDMTIANTDFWSLVYGAVDTSKTCSFCFIDKTTEAQPEWTLTITDDENRTFYNYKTGAKVANAVPCGLVLSGLTVPKEQVGDVTVNLKATLLGFSTDDAGNVNNEFASFPISLRFQAPPL